MAGKSEKTIIDLETKFWDAIVEKDTETAISLLDETSIVTGAQGAAMLRHEDYRSMAKVGEAMYELKSYSFDDVKVTFPAKDVAVIAYKVTENMQVEGKPITLQAADATTWVRKGGEWVAALHTESVLGDPFGRDRKAA